MFIHGIRVHVMQQIQLTSENSATIDTDSFCNAPAILSATNSGLEHSTKVLVLSIGYSSEMFGSDS